MKYITFISDNYINRYNSWEFEDVFKRDIWWLCKITKNSPVDFLSSEKEDQIYTQDCKFRGSLYKVLLFIQVSDSIKSGKLSLKHSYRYLSLDEYLIDRNFWHTHRDALIKRAGLEKFKDFSDVKKTLMSICGSSAAPPHLSEFQIRTSLVQDPAMTHF